VPNSSLWDFPASRRLPRGSHDRAPTGKSVSPLRRAVVRIVAGGFWGLSALALATTYLGPSRDVNYQALWAITGLCYVGGAAVWFVRWDRMPPERFSVVLLGGIALVTVAVHFSGSAGSHLLGLYVLPAVAAGALLDVRRAIAIAAVSGLAAGLPLLGGWNASYGSSWLLVCGITAMAGYIPARVRLALDEESAGLLAEEASRKKAEEALKLTEIRLRTVVANAPVVLWAVDRNGTFILYEGKGLSAAGPRSDAGVGMSVYERYKDRPDILDHVRRAFAGEEVSHTVDFRGGTYDAHYAPLRDDLDSIVGVIGVAVDVSDRERARRELDHRVHHDPITGLPNSTWLREYLEKTIAASGGHRLALLIVNLQQFHEINDTFGHRFADDLLRQISGYMTHALDATGAQLARLEGAEFGVLTPIGDKADAIREVQRLLARLERPFVVNQQPIEVSVTVGISIHPEHGIDAETLLRRAHIAMGIARQNDAGYAFYRPEDDHHSADRIALAAELRRAIEREELVLHYQPQVQLQRGGVTGLESLVRWVHPQRGLVPPADFISLAERTGLIKPLSEWVVRQALHESRQWFDRWPAIHVSVNLSMRNVVDPLLPKTIAKLLNETRARPECLRLEITESILMADPGRAMENIRVLREMGVGFSVDDFGTGYSSLRYLERLPIQEIKIDKSFVFGLTGNRSSRAIVKATIELGHNLGFEVVAEGVEDQESWDVLTQFDCDIAQGHFIARPMPATEAGAWLHEDKRNTGANESVA
jgi:diguanylate cyclase (GGDEF)-like protein